MTTPAEHHRCSPPPRGDLLGRAQATQYHIRPVFQPVGWLEVHHVHDTTGPPFTQDSARQKIRKAEDAWNGQDPQAVALAYTADSWWRNRATFLQGRDQIIEFLKQKWSRELNYRLIKELWAFTDSSIAVRFCYESQSTTGQWYRSYGNENWQFDDSGLMQQRHASINDVTIAESDRKFHWKLATARPADHPGLSELGL